MAELALVPSGRRSLRFATAREEERDLAQHAAEAASRDRFEALLAECGMLVFRVARSVLRNNADAEDVAQEALLRAYRRFDGLRDPGSFRAWLVRIAFRLALDRIRATKRAELRLAFWQRQPVLQRSVEQLAAASEFQSYLSAALDKLPEKLRLVLVLAAMEGHTLEEVAAILELPIGTVKSRLFLGRKQLAEKLRCHADSIKMR